MLTCSPNASAQGLVIPFLYFGMHEACSFVVTATQHGLHTTVMGAFMMILFVFLNLSYRQLFVQKTEHLYIFMLKLTTYWVSNSIVSIAQMQYWKFTQYPWIRKHLVTHQSNPRQQVVLTQCESHFLKLGLFT